MDDVRDHARALPPGLPRWQGPRRCDADHLRAARAVEEIRRRHGAEALFEFNLALEQHVREQKARDADFRTKLREKITEREVCALFPVLLRAAAESPIRERMRMLCAVLAGILRPDLDAEMRSRVARAVLQFEPSDVLYLRDLEELHAFRRALLKPPSGASEPILVSTGCSSLGSRKRTSARHWRMRRETVGRSAMYAWRRECSE